MHYFVFGASGFIGTEVIKALLEKGHRITAAVHRAPVMVDHPGLTLTKCSLKNGRQLLEATKPDIIIHLARVSGGRYGIGRYLQSLRAKRYNAEIRSYLEKNKTVRLFYLSGSLMYGNSDQPVTEKNKLNPISFARQYVIAEKPFVIDPPENCTVLRPGWVFGNGSWFRQFFLKSMEQTQHVPLYGKGLNYMSVIHVSDLARLVVIYTEKAPAANVYNIYSPLKPTQAEFVDTLSRLSQKKVIAYSENEVKQKYNTTILEAFSSNIILESTYTELLDSFRFDYSDLESLLLSEIK